MSERTGAIVMMHGRGGAYSANAHGVYNASTLSLRHQAWGEFWATRGVIALLVDGFGSRGYPGGFPRGSYNDRPDEVNEVTARPLDAYGALSYLQARPDVEPAHIALQGWSNGGGAALAAMAETRKPAASPAFIGAVALYPNCGLRGQFRDAYRPYAPMRVFSGTADEEVSTPRCEALVRLSQSEGGDIGIGLYDGATHGFDSPDKKRQSNPANAAATEDAQAKIWAFLRPMLKP